MQYPIHIVDAFAAKPFTGNPAAVVLFDAYPDDAVLQAIAAENNLAETAFPVPRADGKWDLRWFTPAVEVPLCGHATLASAHVIFHHVLPDASQLVFVTRQSGELTVRRDGDGSLTMDFPADPARPFDHDTGAIFATPPVEVRCTANVVMAVLASAADVRGFAPNRDAIMALGHNLIITAPGDGYGDGGFDCVSRFFAPFYAIDEDPVTGSAHCVIAPYWAERLGRNDIRAWQASARGGELLCRVDATRVELKGRCAPYLTGTITVA